MRLVKHFYLNHLNCLNLLNLRNYLISPSINKGLGEGVKHIYLKAKLCWWSLFKSLWSSGTQNPLVAEESLSQELGCNLNSFIIVNKENPSSTCVLNVFHVSWFDEYLWLSTLCIVYLTCYIYMYKLSLWGFSLYRWRRNIPESFGGEAEWEKTKLGSTVVNQVSPSYLLVSFLYFKVDFLQVLRVHW